jgi:tRNA (mo5U34)-methyltransferase
MNLQERISRFEWYHTIDLGKFGLTEGVYDHREYLPFYGIPDDLRGKRVLDVGAGNGFFSFYFEELGAEVTAINPRDWMDEDQVPSRQHDWQAENEKPHDAENGKPRDNGFLLAKRALKSNVSYRRMNIYDITPRRLKTFDITFCGSLLCHLMNPLKALERIRAVTTERAIVATIVFKHSGNERMPLCLFSSLHNKSANTFWIPNDLALKEMLLAAGFSKVKHVSSFALESQTPPGEGGIHSVMHAYV